MPLTPTQLLSLTNSRRGSTGSLISSLMSQRTEDPLPELEDEKESPDSKKPSKSIFERVKGAAGDIISPIGSALDAGRAGVVATAVEIGDGLRPILRPGEEGDFSLNDLRANFNRRIGVGDVLEENTLTTGMPLNVKRALGLVGDIATDPLNLVTFGGGTVAKQGLARVGAAAGDDVARLAAREGAPAADNLLARHFADKQTQAAADFAQHEANFAEAAAQRASTFDDEAILRLGDPDAALAAADDVLPPLRPDILDATAPTIRSILSEGVTAKGADRTLNAIARRGAGGTQIVGRTIPGTPALGAAAAAPFRAAGTKFIGTEIGDNLRKAFIPLAQTKDLFGKTVADAMPAIVHRRAAMVDAWKADLDNQLRPFVKAAIGTDELKTVTAALDMGGTVDEAALLLTDNPQAGELLRTLSTARDRAYDTLIAAGKQPDELISKEEYLRHVLTPDGMEALGITKASKRRPGSKSGRMDARSEGRRDKSVAELNEMDGIASYIDDPTKLVRSSFHYAQEVGGNAMAFDALEDLAMKAKNLPSGVTPSDIVRRSPAEGFTEMAPGRWVNADLHNDVFALAKAGTQSSIVRAWDNFSSIVKRQTLFNPVAFGPYFTQNMATGVAMNTVDGVRAADYALTARLRNATTKALKQGGEDGFDAALARILPDPTEQAYVKELRADGIFGTGVSLYDDVAAAGPVRGLKPRKWLTPTLGTNNTVKVNQWGEEMLRGSAFVRHRLNGMASDAASNLTRKRHLDYTAIGRTSFERNVINRFVFFPTWLMRAPSAIVRAYAQSPGVFNAQARVEMGTQWYDRERNDYGEILGARLSGPAGFLSGLPIEGLDEPAELLNPLAKYVLDPDSRDAAEVLPPLSNIMAKPGGSPGGRLGIPGGTGGILNNPEKQNRYLRSLGGVRTGVDYGEERGEEQLAEAIAKRIADNEVRVAAGEEPLPELTPTLVLKQTAVEEGIEDPYAMTSGELVRRLIDAGVSRNKIRSILEGVK